MLLDELDTLLPLLCRCEACMATYARAGLQSWFGSELCVAEDCRLLVGEEGEGAGGASAAGAGGGAPPTASNFALATTAFETLPFHHQAALASGYADLKGALLGFLAQRALEGGSSVVITKSDVEGFVKTFREEQERKGRQG